MPREDTTHGPHEACARILTCVQRKTRRYYEVDSLGRKHHTGVVYFGEHKDTRNAWYPHGPGKLLTGCRSLLLVDEYMHVDALEAHVLL